MITQEELKRILNYDPETGLWTWLISRGRAIAGNIAGSYSTLGYLYIKIDGQSYIGARLAWLYMTGEWPEDEIDHINRIPSDDRWVNIRMVDRTGNTQNRVMVGVSGAPGVYRNSRDTKWVAQYNRTYLGSYDTVKEASEARSIYMQEMGLAPTTSDLERNIL